MEIVFNASKYERILVTNDGGSARQSGGILGNRDGLKQLGIEVKTDEEAVALVKQHVRDRDRLLVEKCKRQGESLPAWIGLD